MPVEVRPAAGEVQETVTRRRIISEQKAAPPPPFWDYVARLKESDWISPGGTALHSVYVYRDQPPPTIALGKFTGATFAETGTPWSDQEEMEMAFMHRFGGGKYRFILKKGSERVTTHAFDVPGPYKNLLSVTQPQPQSNPYNGGAGYRDPYQQQQNPYYDPTAAVAETAMRTMANQDKQAVEIGINALAQAAQVIKDFHPAPAPGLADDLQRAFMTAMIARLTAPTPDPIETFARMTQLLRDSSPANGGGMGIAGSVIDKLVASVVERGLNPPPMASGPAVSMGAELVRILPSVAQYVTEGMGNYARIMEAQRDAIAIQKGSPGLVAPRPALQAPAAPVVMPPQPAPAPAAGANGNANMTDAMTWIETKIVEIFREPQSAESAAEEVLSFLDRVDRSIVPQLSGSGEEGLNRLFQTRPALKPALSNPARLQEFIRAFLRFAAEESPTESKPN